MVIPAWVLNMVQESWAGNTLEKFLKVCKKYGTKDPDPAFLGW